MGKNKLNPNLYTMVEQEKKDRKKQETLHEKYQDVPKETKIIENRAVKTVAKVFGTIIRTIAAVIIAVLAIIGVLCLVFPEPREAFLAQVEIIVDELRTFLPFF